MTTRPATTLTDYLRDWRPDRDGASEVAQLYARALNVRVARRCEALLIDVGDAAGGQLAASLADRADRSTWTSPRLAFAWFIGLAQGQETPVGVVEELERVLSIEVPVLDMAPAGPHPAWLRYAQTLLVADSRRGAPDVDPEIIDPGETTLATCREAFALLDGAWPDMSATSAALVRELRWLNPPEASEFGSATLTQAFGAVFLTPARRVALYESLVHETTHFELTARMALDPLVVNGADRALSPLRKVQRPVTRVLHATFVCGRLLEAYRRCLNLLDDDEREFARSRCAQLRDDVAEGLAALAGSCEWTETGAALFEHMRHAVTVSAP